MPEGIYRDGLQGARSRVADLELEIHARLARLTAALTTSLPASLAGRIERLSELASAPRDSLADLARLEQVLTDYRRALDEAIALAPDLEAAQRVLPDRAPDPEPASDPQGGWMVSGWKDVDREVTAMRRKVEQIVSRMDPEVESIALGRVAVRARFRAAGAPLSLLAELCSDPESFGEVRLALATAVSPGAPRLSLAPEGAWEGIARLLTLSRDDEIGDERFDGFFVITGDRGAARRLLTPAVRADLLRVTTVDVPTLEVGAGAAELRWQFAPTSPVIAAATRVLAAIRAAPVDVRLLASDEDD